MLAWIQAVASVPPNVAPPLSLSAGEIIAVVAGLVAIVGGVQVIGNRSISKEIDSKVGAKLARIEEKQDTQKESLDDHKRSANDASRHMAHSLEELRKENGAVRERLSVVEDRTAQILGSGPWAPFKERKQ